MVFDPVPAGTLGTDGLAGVDGVELPGVVGVVGVAGVVGDPDGELAGAPAAYKHNIS